MVTKLISVFIENRKGRLGVVLDVLKSSGVNILSLSLADTAEYGLLRIISDNPQKGREAFANAGYVRAATYFDRPIMLKNILDDINKTVGE